MELTRTGALRVSEGALSGDVDPLSTTRANGLEPDSKFDTASRIAYVLLYSKWEWTSGSYCSTECRAQAHMTSVVLRPRGVARTP
jgi:hypothetical protein